ncbi:MAG TPA: sulfotransferase [Smithellaceae bacterium]|nr:sulfotransferase [Smithellaceae bacterium]
MSLPNFLCIGAQKAGTTLLFDILKRHPDVYLPETKEPHFFDRDDEYLKGTDWYEDHYFRGANSFSRIGEITPSYLFFEATPERLYKVLGPDLKLIILLRHPVDRALSHYFMQYERGIERLSFMEAMSMEAVRTKHGQTEKARFSYISRGFFADQIKRYLKFFSIGNMKILFFEDFVGDIPGTIRNILQFLDVNPDRLPDDGPPGKINVGGLSIGRYLKAMALNRPYVAVDISWRKARRYPVLKARYRRLIMESYREDIESLQSLTGKDLSGWLI